MSDMGQPPFGDQPSYQNPPPGYGPPGYGPPGYPPPGYGAPGYYPPQTESKAIIALVLAIGSFVVCPVVPAIAALVVAGQARAAIASSGGRLTGDGLVTAAKAVAWVNIVFGTLGLLGFLVAAASLPTAR